MQAPLLFHVSRVQSTPPTIGGLVINYLQDKNLSVDTNVIVMVGGGEWASLYSYNLEDSTSIFGRNIFLGHSKFDDDDDRLPSWEKLIAFLAPRANRSAVALAFLGQTERYFAALEAAMGLTVVRPGIVAEEFVLVDEFALNAPMAQLPLRAPVPVEASAYAAGHRRAGGLSPMATQVLPVAATTVRQRLTPLNLPMTSPVGTRTVVNETVLEL